MRKDLDSKLYKEYFEGKKEIFDLLYSKYKSKIEFFIFNIIKDYQKAEDIAQEVFIYVFQNQSKENYSFKNYLYFVAKSRAISYIETEKRRGEITEKYLKNEEENTEPDIVEFITRVEVKKELVEVINELEDKYKNAVYLTQIEELSYKETSEILGESIQNTKNLVHRGKKELRKKLINKGYYKDNKIQKLLIIVLCAGILISGFTFAEEIRLIVHKLTQNIFGTYNEGITTAIENDYEVEIDMDYVESNGVKVRVDSVMLDDYNLGIISSVILDEKFLTNINNFEFENTLIMNEKNEILYVKYEDLEEFYSYCEENNLDAGIYGYGYSDGSYTGKMKNIENNCMIFSFSTSSNKFPFSKKLYVKFNKIKLTKREIDENKDINYIDNVIDGTWEMTIDIEELNRKRNTIEYDVVDINDNRTEVTEARLSMSNMRLELITNTKKIDFKKIQNKDPKTMDVFDKLAFNELYIENSKGEKFSEVASEGTGYETIEPGKIRYHALFEYTYFDRTEEITVHLRTNKKEELIIKMKAKNFERE